MHADVIYRILKIVNWLVLVLMLAAILYASYISISNWSGIGV